jgi:hypothetical protein
VRLFTSNNLTGHYLSADAIVLADTPQEAKVMLAAKMAEIGLAKGNQPEDIALKEVPIDQPGAHVLFNGDY